MAARLAALILVPVLAALMLTGSGNVGPLAVSYGEIRSHREATLFYPGSRLIESDGWGEYAERCSSPLLVCTRRDVPAFVGNQLIVEDATADQIFGWYQDKLSAAGWRPGPSGDSAHIEAYLRGPVEHFDVNVHSVEESRDLIGGQRNLILYFTGYQLGTCPSIEARCRSHFLAAQPNDPGPAKPLPETRLYLDDIADRPEAHLYFPGSLPVGSDGYGEGGGRLVGFADPYVRIDLITPSASRDEVDRWYQTELAARGYTIVGTDSMGVPYEFRRGSEIFKLIIPVAEDSRGPYGVVGLMFAVIYEMDTCQGHHPPLCQG
jgi:hypothetical protein